VTASPTLPPSGADANPECEGKCRDLLEALEEEAARRATADLTLRTQGIQHDAEKTVLRRDIDEMKQTMAGMCNQMGEVLVEVRDLKVARVDAERQFDAERATTARKFDAERAAMTRKFDAERAATRRLFDAEHADNRCRIGCLDAKVSNLEMELAGTKRQLDAERANSVRRITELDAKMNGLHVKLTNTKREFSAERAGLVRRIDALTEELAATKRRLEIIHYRSALVTVRIMTEYAVSKLPPVLNAVGPFSFALVAAAPLSAASAVSASAAASAVTAAASSNDRAQSPISATAAAAVSSGAAAAAPDQGLIDVRWIR
jgi:hypothetical protein